MEKSFSLEELEPVWKIIDAGLTQRIGQMRAEARGGEKELLETGNWDFAPDGRLVPKIHNPAVLGGVHGDETTLPEQIKRIFSHEQIAHEVQVDRSRGYYNPTANPRAIERMKRGLPSDMNRPDTTLDEDTLNEKRAILSEIGNLEKPFLLDCHNYRAGSKQNLAYGYIIDYGKYTEGNKKKIYGRGGDADLIFKIKLAQEL